MIKYVSLALMACVLAYFASASIVHKQPHTCPNSEIIGEPSDALCTPVLSAATVTATSPTALEATVTTTVSQPTTACVRNALDPVLSDLDMFNGTGCIVSVTKTGLGVLTYTLAELTPLASSSSFRVYFVQSQGVKLSTPIFGAGITDAPVSVDLAGLGYYFIDNTGGNDGNTGLSGSPWKTAGAANAAGLVDGDRVYVKGDDPLEDQRLTPSWPNGRLDCYYEDPGNGNQLTDCDEGTEAGMHIAMINGTADAACRATSDNVSGCAHGDLVPVAGALPTTRFQGIIDVGAAATGFHVDDFQVMDSAAEGVYVRANNVTIENTEVGYPFWGGIRADSGVTGMYVKYSYVHHQPYCKYAANVLSHNYYDPICGGGGGPPSITLIVGVTDGVSSATAEGNRIHTGYREAIGCFRGDSYCHVIGNVVSGLRVVSIYIAQMLGGVVESNISYGATDDEWYPGTTGSNALTSGLENNEAVSQVGSPYKENEETIFRNNACINAANCNSSIITNVAVNNGWSNANNVAYTTAVGTLSAYVESNNNNGAFQMINSFFRNSIGYAPAASPECDQSGETTFTTNMWPAAVDEAACADAGDVIATPEFPTPLATLYTTAVPPTFADVTPTPAATAGIGAATPLLTPYINANAAPHFADISFWEGKGVTMANWQLEAFYDCVFNERDAVSPDIGACEQ